MMSNSNDEQIRRFGGLPGLRDRGLLISASARAENAIWYDDDATVASVGASLAWGLIKNHAFIDGNKRVGYVSLVAFLDLNGYGLTCSEDEETLVVKRVAACEMIEAGWTAWVHRTVAPMRIDEATSLR
jgi:death-on-curing protein